MINNQFSFDFVPPVAKRGQQALIALFSTDKKTLYLSRKAVYPSNIYRLFGGGIEKNEVPEKAIIRELEEETKLIVKTSPEPVEQFQFNITETSTNTDYTFTIHLFSLILPKEAKIIPSDDVDEVKAFTNGALSSLIKTYDTLPTELVTKTFGGGFRWSDYGKIFSPVHQKVLDMWL